MRIPKTVLEERKGSVRRWGFLANPIFMVSFKKNMI